MKTTICGIPCQAEITHICGDYVPARVHADPDDCYEAEYPEIEWAVFDRRGRPAPWLERKLTSEEAARIESELIQNLEYENE